MPHTQHSLNRLTPRALFLSVLAIIALAEGSIMLALPHLLPEESTPLWAHIVVDVVALLLICVPLLWKFVLIPLRRAAESESLQARIIMENVIDGIIAIDEQGKVRRFNRAAEDLFGYRAEDILGQNVALLMPAPHRARHDDYLRRYLATGQSHIIGRGVEVQGMRQDGTLFPLELAVSENTIHGRRLFTAIARDLTAKKAAAAQMQRAHTLLETIFTNMPGLIAYLDPGFNFIRVNAAYAAADGKTVDFFPGKNHFELYPDAENAEIFRQVLHSGEPYIAHARPFTYAEHPERGASYWNWVLQPIKAGDGRIDSLLLTLLDVTPQVRAQQELLAKEQYETALLNATAESAFLLEADGTVLSVNEIAAQRFDRPRAALLGQSLWDVMPPALAASCQARLAAVTADGSPVTFENSHDGRHYRISAYPVPDATASTRRIAVFAADITEQWLLRGSEALLHEMDRNLLGGASLAEVLASFCRQLAALFDLQLAWVGRKMPGGAVEFCAGGGPAEPYMREIANIRMHWDGSAHTLGPVCSAIRSGAAYGMDINAPAFQPWRALAEQAGIAYAHAYPLLLRGEVYGALTVYARNAQMLNDPLAERLLSSIVARLDVILEHWLDQQRLRLLSGAVAAAGNSILITNQDGRIEWVNDAFTRLTGYSALEAIGQTPRLLKSGLQDAAYYRQLWETILEGRVWSHETVERRKDGALYTVQQTITPIRDENGRITHFISIQEDISAQKQAEQRIQHMAHHDALTNLPNRVLFQDRLQQAMAQAKRGQDRVALLFIDLDRFKQVNDSHGHAIGDRLLQDVANRLRACVRESDTVARIAGDEFTVVLSAISQREDAALVAEKIIKQLGQPFQFDQLTVQIGASIGIALYPDDAREAEDLMRFADHAMYQAKHASRNTYRFHTKTP